MNRFETYTYTAPAIWASYWINADPSGLSDAEIAEADAAFAKIVEMRPGAGPHPVDCSESEFRWNPDFGVPGDTCVYTFLVKVLES